MNTKISIIMPAYNEEKRIGRTLEEYSSFFKNKKKNREIKDFEILVVLNACKDNTLGVVRESQKKFREIRYLNFIQGGKGFAIIEGFKDALRRDNDLIGFVDADLATSPEAYYSLIKNINGNGGVIASRWKKGAKQNYKLIRKITSRGFNFLTRIILFLPYSDTQCGAKIFKKEVLEKVVYKLEATKWAFDIDLLFKLRKKDAKVKEFPTVWMDKEGSSINLGKVPLQMFLAIIRLRLLYSPFKGIVRLYNKLPKALKIYNL